MLGMREDGVDAIRRRREIVEDADEFARVDLGLDLPRRAPCDPQTRRAPRVEHLAIGAIEPPTRPQMHQFAIDHEGPAARLARVAAERQAFVACQFAGVLRRPGAFQVGRRRHAEAPVVGQSNADEAAVGEVADAHGTVEALVDDVDDPVREVEREADLRVQAQEARHQRCDVATPETGGRGDPKVPAGLHAAGAHAGLRIGPVGQQALAVFEEGAALVGQADPPGGAHQQLDAEPPFERVDPAPDDRRRHALGRGRRGQAAARRDRGERFELLELVQDSVQFSHESIA